MERNNDEQNDWREHAKQLEGMPPRQLLVASLDYVLNRKNALDLGPGALSDVVYLLDRGFDHVVAVDIADNARETARQLPVDRFSYVITSFEDFDFPDKSFDLINAQFSLPFIKPEKFVEVFKRIMNALREQGVFSGNLFSTHDDWFARPIMTFHTIDEALDMEIITLQERQWKGKLASGKMKQWHVIDIIAKRIK